MKKLSVIFASFLIGISICLVSCNIHYSTNTIRGDRNIITSEEAVSPFREIYISGSATVNYHASSEYRVLLTVDSNLLEYVEIDTKGNTLHIGTENGNYSFTKFVVDIYCPHITKVSSSGSVDFECMDKMVVPTFEATISGSGNLKGTFECDDFSVCISGSGDVAVVGESKNSTINISGSGDFKGREFKTNNTKVQVTGSGDVRVWVMDYLNADISGSGDIVYRGSPKIDFNTSGSGRIKSE